MRSFFFIALYCLCSSAFSQNQENIDNRLENDNELRLDGIKLIAGTILEGTYEYVGNKNSGMGISLLVNLDSDNEYPENFSLSPFYRMYFFNRQDYGAKGFFVEGFGKLATGEETTMFDDFNDKENYTDFSLGMSLGKKWVNSNGFVFEILVGVSRSLGGNPGREAYFRGGLFVGYRF